MLPSRRRRRRKTESNRKQIRRLLKREPGRFRLIRMSEKDSTRQIWRRKEWRRLKNRDLWRKKRNLI
jgi:hypothetical protein